MLSTYRRGFTLIELSIVLVIIGLIVGGVLVGQNLIAAAEVRACISQIEKYNTAANTFRGKYDSLPGDMNATAANTLGFYPRGQYAGEGDGNGVIEGVTNDGAGQNNGFAEGAGETTMFWVDLSSANGLNVNLIDGSFSTATPNTSPAGTPVSTSSSPPISVVIANFMPPAKLGRSNFVYVYSYNNENYFGISVPTSLNSTANFRSAAGMTVSQAAKIDEKMDDGMPTTGNVTSRFANNLAIASAVHTGVNASSCYDSASLTYNVGVSNGSSVVCALSFKFQ